jgi:hypothetical protein
MEKEEEKVIDPKKEAVLKGEVKRQIIIETDGISVHIVKAEVASLIEFKAILDLMTEYVVNQSQMSRENKIKKEGTTIGNA